MSRNKPDSQDDIEVQPRTGPGRVFRDTRYTSRTLVFPDGSWAQVIKEHVTADSDEQFAFFEAHPDLELAQE